jgi:hypothetical protein
MAAVMLQGLCLGLIAASLALSPAAAQERAFPSDEAGPGAMPPEFQSSTAHSPKLANFLKEPASYGARQAADWVADSGDNRNLPFAIVDKQDAKVFVFDGQDQLLGAAPALVGLAQGDDSVLGIGDKPLADIGPEERTTPAGRFVGSLGRDLGKLDVLWVDYKDAISLHRVITTDPQERRLQRLATATPLDNRISYGCINVPVKFFDRVVQPAFRGTNGIVYILPEIKSMRQAFPGYYDVED